jgi:alkanesulfonate monooxygenase SsuD/methylene tetrahydromethanopterin reductase-like flavin-dependent oxidoreductase (luciferase family)
VRVFVFDLLPYGEHLAHLKEGRELPWPLPRRHFKPDVAVRTYEEHEEHLAAWETMDRIGYDGVGFNEHHTSPYGLEQIQRFGKVLPALQAHQVTRTLA